MTTAPERELIFFDSARQPVEWDPGTGPAFATFAPLLDTVLGPLDPDAGTHPWVTAFDGDGLALMMYPYTALLTTVEALNAGDTWENRYLDYLSTDDAMAIAAEFIDGELDALRARPWSVDFGKALSDPETNRDIVLQLLDAYVLDAIGELTLVRRQGLEETDFDMFDLLEVPAADWRTQVETSAVIHAQRLIELARRGWRSYLDHVREHGGPGDRDEFARAFVDRLFGDASNSSAPWLQPLLDERVTVSSTATGTRIEATAHPLLEPMLRQVIGWMEDRPEDWNDGFMIRIQWGPLALAADGDGYVVRSPDYTGHPYRDSTDDLTLALAIPLDMEIVASRSGAPEVGPISFSDVVACWPGWADETHVFVQGSSGENGHDLEIWPHEEPDGESGGVEAWQVLQRRGAAVSAFALADDRIACLENDWVRLIRDQDGVVARGPFWTFRRLASSPD
jgi:hypothetical protein